MRQIHPELVLPLGPFVAGAGAAKQHLMDIQLFKLPKHTI